MNSKGYTALGTGALLTASTIFSGCNRPEGLEKLDLGEYTVLGADYDGGADPITGACNEFWLKMYIQNDRTGENDTVSFRTKNKAGAERLKKKYDCGCHERIEVKGDAEPYLTRDGSTWYLLPPSKFEDDIKSNRPRTKSRPPNAAGN